MAKCGTEYKHFTWPNVPQHVNTPHGVPHRLNDDHHEIKIYLDFHLKNITIIIHAPGKTSCNMGKSQNLKPPVASCLAPGFHAFDTWLPCVLWCCHVFATWLLCVWHLAAMCFIPGCHVFDAWLPCVWHLVVMFDTSLSCAWHLPNMCCTCTPTKQVFYKKQ